jgi:hypothetical protein
VEAHCAVILTWQEPPLKLGVQRSTCVVKSNRAGFVGANALPPKRSQIDIDSPPPR